MSTNHKTSAEPSDQTETSFQSWMVRLGRKAMLISTAGPLVSFAASLVKNAEPLPRVWQIALPVLVPACQAVIISLLIYLLPRPRTDKEDYPVASAACEQFYHCWCFLWVSWLALYVVLAAIELARGVAEIYVEPWESGIANFFNNVPTVFIVAAYLILSESTVKPNGQSQPVPYASLVGTLVIVTGAEMVFTLIELSTIDTIPAFANLASVRTFRWVSGIAACVAIALLVGRLEGKTIDAPRWVVVLLYLYAAIQVAWAAFSQDSWLMLILLNVALLLKCCLFLFVAWLIQTGMLLYYMEKVRLQVDSGSIERKEFLQHLARKTLLVR